MFTISKGIWCISVLVPKSVTKFQVLKLSTNQTGIGLANNSLGDRQFMQGSTVQVDVIHVSDKQWLVSSLLSLIMDKY